jgi:hypothetical protein
MSFQMRDLRKPIQYQTKLDRAVSKFENQKKSRWTMQMDVLHKAMEVCPKYGKDWLTLCSIEGQVTLTQNFNEKQLTAVTTIYMRHAR